MALALTLTLTLTVTLTFGYEALLMIAVHYTASNAPTNITI